MEIERKNKMKIYTEYKSEGFRHFKVGEKVKVNRGKFNGKHIMGNRVWENAIVLGYVPASYDKDKAGINPIVELDNGDRFVACSSRFKLGFTNNIRPRWYTGKRKTKWKSAI